MAELKTEPGWLGAFTREEAPGAIPNGRRVVKVRGDPNAAHPLGAEAIVLGSLHAPAVGYGYFVEWDAQLWRAVFVAGYKIKPKENA